MHRTSWLLELLILDTVGSQEPVRQFYPVIRATDLAALNLHKTGLTQSLSVGLILLIKLRERVLAEPRTGVLRTSVLMSHCHPGVDKVPSLTVGVCSIAQAILIRKSPLPGQR